MELLGDLGHVESCFGPFRDVLVSVQDSRLKWKFDSIHFEIVLTLTQDRCMVCTERSICSEIVLDAPDGTPR
jgi:hypothetical protein